MSIKEVAKIAGVSISTVSRCLNSPDQVKSKTLAAVQSAIAQTGYAPNALARNFRRGKTGLVMVVLQSVGLPFWEGVMRGINGVAQEEGYSILIRETASSPPELDEYCKMVMSKEADGIIILASPSPFAGASAYSTQDRRTPIVLGCENVTDELAHIPSVRVDNRRAASEATQYLLQLGHERIGFIAGSRSSLLTRDRERGYWDAMKSSPLGQHRDWVANGDQSIDGARRATRKLLSLDAPPTAIFCANDEMAMASIYEIKRSGLRVPEDVSVVGFDDIRYAAIMDPPLTTVVQPTEEIGERTMRRLLNAIEGRDIGEAPEIVEHRLIVRESTAPPRAAGNTDEPQRLRASS
ncbi:LacI family DNA-binding transcriptional regulator [Marinimicrobium sp. ABcell2]|uniref:LacI family DNA-binding transcriptional regulator n=1 Tax=Marinimicrobium sp. ABcell2 TaxID=3069751 RepID=UPI0027B82B1A|nr:LacI family DNA-binding transcriptional regulator [Marinimicrobium sp. ABcell2]MDQ2076127.1 LacI family DNA-binding transcriptional regulator [Marinimicrobium sp. ABcell2]